MKKFLVFIFIIASFILPAEILADECPDDGTITYDSTQLKMSVSVKFNGPLSTNYDLIYVAGSASNENFGSCDATIGQVNCLISPDKFNNTDVLSNGGGVLFKLEGSNDNCTFDLNHSDIKTAVDNYVALSGVPLAAGLGVTAPPPAAGGGGTVTLPCHTEFDPVGTNTGVETGLGCIPTQPQELVKWILKYAILMGGGIAFLLSLFGGVSIILAGGNPEKINAGKEIISSALTGLLFIIFSVFLLRFIGYDILQLPGFGK